MSPISLGWIGGVGRDNDVLDETFRGEMEGKVKCREPLGGVIKIYYREAA